jgi:hypothetical protein
MSATTAALNRQQTSKGEAAEHIHPPPHQFGGKSTMALARKEKTVRSVPALLSV